MARPKAKDRAKQIIGRDLVKSIYGEDMVICYAGEYQALVQSAKHEPDPAIRKMLARYGVDIGDDQQTGENKPRREAKWGRKAE